MEKKKGTPNKKNAGGRNSPVIGNNGLDLDPGDNTKYLKQSLELMNLSTIDLHNSVEVQERLNCFFEIMAKYDTKPTVAGMALALNGLSRQWLWAVVHDKPLGGRGNYCTLPKASTDVIKRAYYIMDVLWENYMQNGKINPVAGIFLGKNNFGYQDKSEYILTPNTRDDSDYSAEEIKQRYLPDNSKGN